MSRDYLTRLARHLFWRSSALGTMAFMHSFRELLSRMKSTFKEMLMGPPLLCLDVLWMV